LYFVFALCEGKKRNTDKMASTMLPFVLSEVEGQAKRRLCAALHDLRNKGG
jgi:hypothetical protein